MGIKILSSSSYEGYERRYNCEPDPKNFKIEEVIAVGNHLVAIVHYPNATNYEGKKVLVFKDLKEEELRQIKVLDPHFSEKGVAPIARFEPTDEGIQLAISLCKIMK